MLGRGDLARRLDGAITSVEEAPRPLKNERLISRRCHGRIPQNVIIEKFPEKQRLRIAFVVSETSAPNKATYQHREAGHIAVFHLQVPEGSRDERESGGRTRRNN